MKFRAVIHDALYMKEFLNMQLTLSKLTKESLMIISTDKVEFIINEELTSTAPFLWTEINSNAYFDEYSMKGIDDEHEQIFLTLNPNNLVSALSTVRNFANFIKFKLTNVQFPCLSVDIEFPSSSTADTRRITHDVPVNVIAYRDWIKYKAPQIIEPQIIIEMPNIKLMRNLLDKIKNITPAIMLGATSEGELTIAAETHEAIVVSHFRDLEIKKFNQEQSDDDNPNDPTEFSCTIDCKKTALFLSALQISYCEMTIGIVQPRLVSIKINIRNGVTLLCVIPAVCF